MLSTTHIVHNQLLLAILSSELPHTHLDKVLERGGHVNVLILQQAATGPQLHFLHQPADGETEKDKCCIFSMLCWYGSLSVKA